MEMGLYWSTPGRMGAQLNEEPPNEIVIIFTKEALI